jgi:aryl sulfotransferase
MRASAGELAPDGGVLKDSAAFFRRGRSGAGREVLTGAEIARYHARAAQLAPAGLLSWLHSPGQPRR